VNKRLINQLNIVLAILIFSTPILARMNAPDPYLYKRPSEIWDKDKFEGMMMNPWIVFAAREGLRLYQQADETSRVTYTALFLDKFEVMQKKGRYIFVENDAAPEIKGWGRIEQFIILPHAIKTKHSITHKAVLINKLKRIQGSINIVNPLNAPHKKATPTGKQLKILEFANIYLYYPSERNPTYVLLGKKPFFYPFEENAIGSVENTILGWVPAERVFTWDTREAFQPSKDRKHPIYYFSQKKDMLSYYEKHPNDNQFPTCDNVPTCKKQEDKELLVISPDIDSKIDRSPWPPEAFRYAILDQGTDPGQPFLIGVPGATPDISRITQHIEKQSKVSEVRDVVFLIDATKSMEPYLVLAGKIAKKIMEKFRLKKDKLKEIGELRFGAAIYRDYADELPYQYEVVEDLTTQVSLMKNRLEHISVRRNFERPNDPAYYPEAVFQGIVHCVRGMNWKQGSRKLVIHIGDAGNHSRGQDRFKEKDIARLLVENDISYSAILITSETRNKGRIAARKLFCKQTRTIINETAQIWWEEVAKMENDRILPVEKAIEIKEDLEQLIDSAGALDCCQNDLSCCPCGDRRWTLRCVSTDHDYERTISKQIDKLANQLFEVKSMLEIFRTGRIPSLAQKKEVKKQETPQEKSVSYRPQLMPGVVKSLVKRIGEDLISRLNDKNVRHKSSQILGSDMMNKLSNPEIRKEAVNKLGTHELSKYLKADAQFFTRAYVMLKRPGKKYQNDPDQMTKMVIFQRKELERLLQPLTIFKEKYHCQLHPGNIKRIWRDFMLAIIGESDEEYIDPEIKNASFEELYKQQYGIALRKKHPLLKISYVNIDAGMIPSGVDIGALQKYLCHSQRQLKKLYDSSERFFKVFGDEYIWVEADLLP
jgi:hypothetical protein